METLCAALNVTGTPKTKPCSGACANESNYVDLGGMSTVKVTFTGEGNQRAIFKRQENREEHDELTEEGHPQKCKDAGARKDDASAELEEPGSDVMDSTDESSHELEDRDSADMYLNSRCESESEDGDYSPTETITADETETHYITTHEIQLTELDHDVDHELGRTASSCWDYEDDNLVYSFVDYASFKSDSTTDRRGRHPPKPGISTESECYESDEGGRNTTGHVHVSIKSSSRTVKTVEAPSAENIVRLDYRGDPGKIPALYDIRADCFIPAPGRQHLASKLKGKDVTEYSSGASSSVSELDDADKEVRNLTAKSFRSLACPYFDTIDLRPSSESSVSEHGPSMNKWSAFVDFDCRQSSTCSLEMRKHTECQNRSSLVEARTLQSGVATSKYTSTQLSTSVTCHAGADFLTARERREKCAENPGSSRAESVCEATREQCGAMFASSLLKNVISKKMRFEQERKMERGQTRAANQAPSPHRDATGCKGSHVETSETESGRSVVSVEELADTMDAVSQEEEVVKEASIQSTSAAEVKPQEAPAQEGDPVTRENAKASECEVTCQVPAGSGATPGSAGTPELTEEKKEGVTATNGKTTKMSHLFVPGSRFLPKDKDTPDGLSERTMPGDTDASTKPPEIKIHLRSVKESRNEHEFNIASLLTPRLAKTTPDPAKTHLGEKVPHFTVRDVRDSRCKLQTPIHQVRDVRKLVKSSYRFVPLDSGDGKSGLFALREEPDFIKKDKEDQKAGPVPMVIKCQSVNTNSTNKQSNAESDRSSPKLAAKSQALAEPQDVQVKTVRWKLEKSGDVGSGGGGDKRVECKLTNQAALEKLKAAVKTMERLYVFDRNEWRRKTEAPRPVTDSHVLSLITSEEQASDGERIILNPGCPLFREMPKTDTFKTSANIQDVPKIQRPSNGQDETASFVQTCPSKAETEERIGGEGNGQIPSAKSLTSAQTQQRPVTDSENYLTIPIKPHPPEGQQFHQSPAPTPQPRPPLQRSPVVTESWSPACPALTFQHALPAAQVVRVTPPTDPSQASSTQRKLLLDPMTGQCYLVDTPIALQPVPQRLYYPEGAGYMDVPLPVALSPAAYVICPPAFVPPHSPSASSDGDAAGASVCTTIAGTQPVISITSQQGPRIVAPPSFDGTTMSFVVEHG